MTAASGSVATVRKRATFLLAGLTAITVAGFALTLARPSTAGSPARLEVVDSNVQIRPAAAAAFDTVESVTDLAGGSQVRTDDTGSAEIDYSDGSLTRIGPNSQYKVEALQIRGDQRQIVGRLEVGRTFHQVSKLSGSDSRFEVHTANAVAAVRGTAFTVNCKVRLVCDFGVTEGVVNVRGSDGSQVDLLAGQSVTVTASGSVGEVSLLSQSDPWLAENAELPRPGEIAQSKVGSASSGTTTPASERVDALPAADSRPPRSSSSTAAPTSSGSAPSPSAPPRRSTPSTPSRDVEDSFPATATTSSPPTSQPRATSTTRPAPTSTTRPAPTSTTARPVTSTTQRPTTSTTQRSTTSTRPTSESTSSTSTPPTPPTTVRSTTSTTTVSPTTTTSTARSTTTTVGGPDPVTTTTSTTGATTTTSTTVSPTTTTTEQETTTTTEQATTTTTRDTSPSSTIPVCPEDSKNAGNPPPCGDDDDDDGEDGGTTTTSTSSTTTTTTTTTTIPPETTTTTSTSTTSTSTTTTEQETTTTTRDHTPSSTIPVCPDDSPNAGNPPPCGNEGKGKDKEKSKDPD